MLNHSVSLLNGLFVATYDFDGHLDCVHRSDGATAWVPGCDDYDSQNPLTLELFRRLQSAQEELPTFREDMIVAIATPASSPNWESLQVEFPLRPAYRRIVGHNSDTQVINSALVWTIGQLGNDPTVLPRIAALWNAIATIAVPTPEEIDDLNQLAIANRLPFTLNPQGLMGVV